MPFDEFFQFIQLVAEGGYTWARGHVIPRELEPEVLAAIREGGTSQRTQEELLGHQCRMEWLLTDGLPATGDMSSARPIRPLDCRTLYQEFAKVPPTRDAILQFANTWGVLRGRAERFFFPERYGQNASLRDVERGELLAAWQTEILRMRQAIDLWNRIQLAERDARKSKRLASVFEHIRWLSGFGVLYVSHPDILSGDDDAELRNEISQFFPHLRKEQSYDMRPRDLRPTMVHETLTRSETPELQRVAFIATRRHNPHVLQLFQQADPLAPARYYLQQVLNEGIEALVSPQFAWDSDRRMSKMHFVPISLLGVLWLQFGAALQGNVEHRSCPQCGDLIEISRSKTGHTKRRTFCTDTCRVSWNRQERSGVLSEPEGRYATIEKGGYELLEKGIDLESLDDSHRIKQWLQGYYRRDKTGGLDRAMDQRPYPTPDAAVAVKSPSATARGSDAKKR